MISGLPKHFELQKEWLLKISKYQELVFYARLFDEYE